MPRSGGRKKWKSASKSDQYVNPKRRYPTTKAVSEYSQEVQDEVQALFEKKFAFVKPTETGASWELPLVDKIFSAPVTKDWDPELNRHKMELNDLKCQLSDKEIRQWHQHTSFTHRSALVMPHLRNNLWAELCTQAWCKFYEIVSSYSIVHPYQTDFNSLHLCEAPGAFITGLNHYLKSSKDLKHLTWNWLATTLNPYYEGNDTDTMIADDRFILQTQSRWFFGDDNTGDLMDMKNLTTLKQRVENTMRTVNLVTADGSINCQNDPSEQEIVVSQLHYCEVVTAMSILATGGSFILKMFTLFEHQTACLLYLLNCTFQQVHVCKPATSKAGNSEVYVVCLGFVGPHCLQEYMPKLLSHFGPAESPEALFATSDIPATFLEQLHSCADVFKTYQMDAISKNIWLYPQMSGQERHRLTQVRECCRQAYVERFAIQSIRKADKICFDDSKTRDIRPSVGMFTKTATKRLHGTFMERQELDHGPWQLRLNADHQQIDQDLAGSGVIVHALQNNCELMPADIATWDVTVGKRLTAIHSSSFCVAEVLDDWNLALTNVPPEIQSQGHEVTSPSHCDQTLVYMMMADLANLHKISKGESIRCVCLLSDSQHDDTFLQLLNSTGHWSLEDCLVSTTPSVARVTLRKRRDATDNIMEDSRIDSSSPLGMSHLGDPSILHQCCQELSKCKVPVTFSDCSPAKNSSLHRQVGHPDEVDTRLKCLASVILALHVLRVNGSLIICLPELLTRSLASLLYVIYKTFHHVTLIDAATTQRPRGIFVSARMFAGVHPCLVKHLFKVYTSILEMKSRGDSQDVLQFVPQSHLCEKDFNSAITTFNEKVLQAETSRLVKADRQRTDGKTTEQNR